jgi:hypothetical protein
MLCHPRHLQNPIKAETMPDNPGRTPDRLKGIQNQTYQPENDNPDFGNEQQRGATDLKACDLKSRKSQ